MKCNLFVFNQNHLPLQTIHPYSVMVRRIKKIMKLFRSRELLAPTGRVPEAIRRSLLEKYHHKCAGNVPGYPCDYSVVDALEVDHILPRSIRCCHKKFNLQILCSNCHTLKTKKYDIPLIRKHKSGLIEDYHIKRHLRLFL